MVISLTPKRRASSSMEKISTNLETKQRIAAYCAGLVTEGMQGPWTVSAIPTKRGKIFYQILQEKFV